jgi:hypothetical protein
MLIDTEHLHYWMQAIRQSSDPMRTMDAFWSGQLKSKEWLIKNLSQFVEDDSSVDIHGGWVGVLASLLFQSSIPITTIRSIDIDPSCEAIATMMNKHEEMQGRFLAVTNDMCNVSSFSDIVINTSCEHIFQDQYEHWLSNVSNNSIIVVQSNNYVIPEHIRIASSVDDFVEQSKIVPLWSGELELPLYKRFMIIGRKYE